MLRASLTVIGLTSFALFAGETKVNMKDLPPAVQKTVQEETRNAKLKGLSKEVEHGQTFYEAETMVNGRSRDILIDSTGKVVEVEEQADLAAVPAAARQAFEKQGKVVKVETSTKGSNVTYEAVVMKNGKKSEVAVNADGSAAKEN